MLSSRGDNTCSLTKSVRQEIDATWLCWRCTSPVDGIKSLDIEIHSLLKKPIYYVLGGGVSLIRNDLIVAIGADIVKEYCYLGNVFKEKSVNNSKYSTIRGKYGVYERGGSESTMMLCENCSRIMYFPDKNRYLVDIPKNVPILGSMHMAGILVNETIYQKLLTLNIAQLEIVKVPLLDAPCDNFPEFRGYITR
jgi:hypothetical protein